MLCLSTFIQYTIERITFITFSSFSFLFSPLDSIFLKRAKIIWDPETPDHRVSPHGSPGDSQSILDVQAKRPRICPYNDASIEYLHVDEVNLWGLVDYAKAGKLLNRPPIAVEFVDEHEMRKVYSLIYDVFRCKSTFF